MKLPVFPKIKFVNKELIDEVRKLRFSEEDFQKFKDPNDSRYEDYKDRIEELWHDRGYNNAIDSVLRILES